MASIWNDYGFKPIHYRVLWWMIDMGAMRGPLVRGWMGVCAGDLGVHRITLNRVIKRLVAKGFLAQGKKGTFGLVAESFESDADVSRVKVLAEKSDAVA